MIAASAGGFTGTLDASDSFGYDVGEIGDLDGDGVPDLLSGAAGDDDGQADAGAVWVLFLNANGTVKGHQKISSTQGSFTGNLQSADRFGFSVCGVSDLDNNGVMEILSGTWWDDDGGNGKGASYVLFVDGVPICNPDAAFTASASQICQNDTLMLIADNASQTQYEWLLDGTPFSSDTTAMLALNTPGTYTISLVVGDTSCSDSTVQTIIVDPSPTTYAGADTSICGDQLQLSATDPAPGVGGWTVTSGSGQLANATDPQTTVSGLAPGLNVLTWTTQLGNCSGTDQISIQSNAIPTVGLSGLDPLYCSTDLPATLSGTPAGGTFSGPGVSGTSFDPSSAGVGMHTVIYTYTDGQGCTGADTTQVQVDLCQGLNSVAFASDLILYPNPNQGTFFVKGFTLQPEAVELWDLLGRKLKLQNTFDSGQLRCELNGAAAGSYMVLIRWKDEVVSRRVVIMDR